MSEPKHEQLAGVQAVPDAPVADPEGEVTYSCALGCWTGTCRSCGEAITLIAEALAVWVHDASERAECPAATAP